MHPEPRYADIGCKQCASGELLDFDFSMALQPIVRYSDRSLFAQEALVRGLGDEPAGSVFANVTEKNRYRFDQSCRVKAIKLAAELGIPGMLSINFMPNAVYKAELCIRTTLQAASEFNFPHERIIFEVTEGEQITDRAHLKRIVEHYQQTGFKTAIDDFGAGYSGLNLLADMQTDLVKLDMALVRNIDADRSRQIITRGILQVCEDLGIEVIAEGIETRGELSALVDLGVDLFQGFLFARPAYEAVADIDPQAFSREV
jgi:EAL domain-containing protein (putative c-di-GMP-specific phosphodiesterase class I)